MGVFVAQKSPIRISLPRFHYRVGLHIVLFEVCSAFTRVAACTLAPSPISSPPCLPRLLPAGAIAGWALHPLEKRRLVTAHVDHSSFGTKSVAARRGHGQKATQSLKRFT